MRCKTFVLVKSSFCVILSACPLKYPNTMIVSPLSHPRCYTRRTLSVDDNQHINLYDVNLGHKNVYLSYEIQICEPDFERDHLILRYRDRKNVVSLFPS